MKCPQNGFCTILPWLAVTSLVCIIAVGSSYRLKATKGQYCSNFEGIHSWLLEKKIFIEKKQSISRPSQLQNLLRYVIIGGLVQQALCNNQIYNCAQHTQHCRSLHKVNSRTLYGMTLGKTKRNKVVLRSRSSRISLKYKKAWK